MSDQTILQLVSAPSSPSGRKRPLPTLSDDFFLHLRDILKRDGQYATAANLMAVSRAFYDLYSPLIDYTRLTLKEDNVEQVLWGAHPDHVQKSLGSPNTTPRKLSNLNKCTHLTIEDLQSLRHLVDQYGNLASPIFTAVTHLSLGSELVLELAFRTDEELDRYFHGMGAMFAPRHVCVDYPTAEAVFQKLSDGSGARKTARTEAGDPDAEGGWVGDSGLGTDHVFEGGGPGIDHEATYDYRITDTREAGEKILDILDFEAMVLETVGGDWYSRPVVEDEDTEEEDSEHVDDILDHYDFDAEIHYEPERESILCLDYNMVEGVPNFVNWLVKVWAPDSVTQHGVLNHALPEPPRALTNYTRFRVFYTPQGGYDFSLPVGFLRSRLERRAELIAEAVQSIGNLGTCFFELIGAGMTGSEDGGSETNGEAMTELSGETSGEGHPEHLEVIEADEELEDPEAEIKDIFYEGYLVDRKILDQMVRFVSTAEADACACCGGK